MALSFKKMHNIEKFYNDILYASRQAAQLIDLTKQKLKEQADEFEIYSQAEKNNSGNKQTQASVAPPIAFPAPQKGDQIVFSYTAQLAAIKARLMAIIDAAVQQGQINQTTADHLTQVVNKVTQPEMIVNSVQQHYEQMFKPNAPANNNSQMAPEYQPHSAALRSKLIQNNPDTFQHHHDAISSVVYDTVASVATKQGSLIQDTQERSIYIQQSSTLLPILHRNLVSVDGGNLIQNLFTLLQASYQISPAHNQSSFWQDLAQSRGLPVPSAPVLVDDEDHQRSFSTR